MARRLADLARPSIPSLALSILTAHAFAQYIVNVGVDAPDADLTDGVADIDLATPGLQTSLRAAIQEINLLPAGSVSTIQFAHNYILLSFGGVGDDTALVGDLDIRNSVVIRGNGQGVTTIDGSVHADRAFHIINIPGIVVEFRDLSIIDATSPTSPFGPGQGGAIKHDGGDLIIDNVAFIRCRAIGSVNSDGGAIHSSARISSNNCYFEANRADGNGGSIHSDAYCGSTNEVHIQNVATRRGGAVHSTGFYDTISSRYIGNRAQLQGGAVYIATGAQGSFLFDHFEANDSAASGGAIANAGPIDVQNSRFILNRCTGSGGAIRISADSTITQCTIDANVANSFGGGIAVDLSATATISQIDAFLNIAHQSGGGISNGGVVSLKNSTLRDNFANGPGPAGAGGAGVYNLGYIDIVNSTIMFNHAPAGRGAGVLNAGFNSTADITATTIAMNDAAVGHTIFSGGGFGPAFTNITHTVLYTNFPGPGVAGPDPIASLGWNFDADGTALLGGPGDLSGTPGSPWDPMLSPPTFVPGSRGPMLLPVAPSPLRQAGGPGPITSPNGNVILDDQAQRARPPHSADIGAAQEPCRADYNLDGLADILDILDFFNDFGNLNPRADVNLDGIIDIQDFLDFFNWFGIGCP
ncbi:MAG: hypothetical protein KF705_09630 [Phycisphaeraceae bacterium]|nr:hypothetical protein [Phycisphaeraceae bacterium]